MQSHYCREETSVENSDPLLPNFYASVIFKTLKAQLSLTYVGSLRQRCLFPFSETASGLRRLGQEEADRRCPKAQ